MHVRFRIKLKNRISKLKERKYETQNEKNFKKQKNFDSGRSAVQY